MTYDERNRIDDAAIGAVTGGAGVEPMPTKGWFGIPRPEDVKGQDVTENPGESLSEHIGIESVTPMQLRQR